MLPCPLLIPVVKVGAGDDNNNNLLLGSTTPRFRDQLYLSPSTPRTSDEAVVYCFICGDSFKDKMFGTEIRDFICRRALRPTQEFLCDNTGCWQNYLSTRIQRMEEADKPTESEEEQDRKEREYMAATEKFNRENPDSSEEEDEDDHTDGHVVAYTVR